MPEGIASPHSIEVVWDGGMRFRGGEPGGPGMLLDGRGEVAPSPVDALLVALGSCAAIDVVEILEKRRTPPTAVKVAIDFARAPAPPRRITAARLVFSVAVDSERHHVERAIELSLEKYCSVSNTFAPDIDIEWTAEISPASEPASL